MITFTSNAYGELIMFKADARNILSIIGKNPNDNKGVITIEQMPDAISALQSAMEMDKKLQRETAMADNDEAETEEPVYLHQRALPVLQMLERSLQENEPVVWNG